MEKTIDQLAEELEKSKQNMQILLKRFDLLVDMLANRLAHTAIIAARIEDEPKKADIAELVQFIGDIIEIHDTYKQRKAEPPLNQERETK